MKLRDDANPIDLDMSLEKYRTAKDFLFRLLDGICQEYDFSTDQLMNDGARDRLVLASGGVARDFLSVLRGAISEAREMGADRIRVDGRSIEPPLRMSLRSGMSCERTL